MFWAVFSPEVSFLKLVEVPTRAIDGTALDRRYLRNLRCEHSVEVAHVVRPRNSVVWVRESVCEREEGERVRMRKGRQTAQCKLTWQARERRGGVVPLTSG